MLKVCTYAVLAILPFAGIGQITNYSVGDVVPDFTGIEADGTEHNLYSYTAEGKYVLIDFFAYWCGPCMATAPKIQEFYEKYGCNSGNIVVLGNECDPGGANEHLEAFNEAAGLDPSSAFPSWSGMEGNGADIGNMYGPAAYPTVALIGPDNTLLHYDIWPIPDINAIEDAFPPGVLMPKACEVVTTVGNEEAANQIILAPNPANDYIQLRWQSTVNGAVHIQLLNQYGQVVLLREVTQINGSNTFQLAVNQLPEGIYIVDASADGLSLWQKTLQVLR